MLQKLTLALVLVAAAFVLVSASEDRNFIQNLKTNVKSEFSAPNQAISGLVQHLGLVFKGVPSSNIEHSVSSLNLFERPLVGIVLSTSSSNDVNQVISNKVQSLFGKDAVSTVSTLKGIDFSDKRSEIVIVTGVKNVESELKMVPERSDVVLLNLEKKLEVMTPAQRNLLSVSYTLDNSTTNNTSNSTITDAERADYQMQLWTWVIGIVCVILAVWAVTMIDYSGDQMLYALEMTKSHHE